MPASVTPRTRIRSTDRAVTRELLLDAAVDVFREVGYPRATIDQIVARAGASRGTYYLHFKTKSEILPELVARSGGAFTGHYEQLTAVIGSGDRALITAWLLEAMRRWSGIEDLMRPVYEATAGDPELARVCFAGEEMPGLSAMTEALRGTGLIAADRVETCAEVLFAPLLHFFHKHLRGDRFDREVAAGLIADAWASTISG